MHPLIRRAKDRGHFQNRRLDTHYMFSFADYEDSSKASRPARASTSTATATWRS